MPRRVHVGSPAAQRSLDTAVLHTRTDTAHARDLLEEV